MMHQSPLRSAVTPMDTIGCAIENECRCGRLLDCSGSRGAIDDRNSRTMQRGDSLFRCGDRIHHLYVVRTGAFKSFALDESGCEHVLGFHLPGDTMGMDALGRGVADTNLVSLDTSRVCVIAVERLMERARESRDRMTELCAGLYSEMQRLRGQVQMDRRSADERLAVFLLAYSGNLCRRGRSPLEFSLPMSRRDLASFLGIASETMSRLFARFQALELVEAKRNRIRLLDPERLSEMAGEPCAEAPPGLCA